MAVPVAAIVKAAVVVLSNEKTRKTAGWVIAAILSPLILLIVLICALMSGTADHNSPAVDLTFHGRAISAQSPPEYRQRIETEAFKLSEQIQEEYLAKNPLPEDHFWMRVSIHMTAQMVADEVVRYQIIEV